MVSTFYGQGNRKHCCINVTAESPCSKTKNVSDCWIAPRDALWSLEIFFWFSLSRLSSLCSKDQVQELLRSPEGLKTKDNKNIMLPNTWLNWKQKKSVTWCRSAFFRGKFWETFFVLSPFVFVSITGGTVALWKVCWTVGALGGAL